MAVENAYFLELLQWQRSILAAGLDVILAAGSDVDGPIHQLPFSLAVLSALRQRDE